MQIEHKYRIAEEERTWMHPLRRFPSFWCKGSDIAFLWFAIQEMDFKRVVSNAAGHRNDDKDDVRSSGSDNQHWHKLFYLNGKWSKISNRKGQD